jgi:hypothetical protein
VDQYDGWARAHRLSFTGLHDRTWLAASGKRLWHAYGVPDDINIGPVNRSRTMSMPIPLSKRSVALAQTAYYVPTSIWPILHMRSFEWITGPKVDRWLVKTVAGLIGVAGSTIGLAAARDRINPEIEWLGIGSALTLATIDVIYVRRRRIRPVYLLDAIANLGLAAGYLAARRYDDGQESPEQPTPIPGPGTAARDYSRV